MVGKLDVLLDTLKTAEKANQCRYDFIIDLDLTSPLRTVEDIMGTLKSVCSDPDADVAFSVTEARRSPCFNMVTKKENGYYDKVIESQFVSRQQAPAYYDMNASIYAYKRSYLLDFSNIQHRKALIWQMYDTGVLDIDCDEDFELMQVIAKYMEQKQDGYREIIHRCYNLNRISGENRRDK